MPGKKDLEAEVMGEAYAAFAKLKDDQDAQSRILRYLSDRLNLAPATLADVEDNNGGVLGPDSGKKKPADAGIPTPKAFFAQKRPGDFVERMACLAYYLTNFRETSKFKTQDLTRLNSEAAQPPLSNPSVFANNAVRSQYLSPAGLGKKQLTARGEAMVEALPDREAVKQALEQHPLFGKRGGKSKKPSKRKSKSR